MTNEEWCKLLDSIEARWQMGTEWVVKGYANKDDDKTPPEKGYVVVKELKKPTPSDCEWCGNTTVSEKTYSRSCGSNVWKGKCHDETCKLKQNFHATELNKMINISHKDLGLKS